MTTAADELRTAAERLRKLTADATPGPWHRPLNTRYKATVTGPLPEGERGTWLDGIDPATGERERCTVAMVNTWSNGKHARDRSGRDLEYIAALHPGVGTALANLLDTAAKHYRDGFLCCEHGPDSCSEVVAPALAVARAILGGQP